MKQSVAQKRRANSVPFPNGSQRIASPSPFVNNASLRFECSIKRRCHFGVASHTSIFEPNSTRIAKY